MTTHRFAFKIWYHHFAKYQLFPMIAEFYAVILVGLGVKALVEQNFEKVI
jgi:hypothetical protein